MKELKKILIKTKREFFLNYFGHNLSKISGYGFDFSHIKEYVYGDELKFLNFKAYAKTNKLFINRFSEEKKLNITIVLLLNGSLNYEDKKDIAKNLLFSLSYIALLAKNSLNVVIFSKELVKFYNNLSIKKMAIVFEDLKKLNAKNEVDFIKLEEFLIRQKKSLIFLIGDFLDYQKFKSAHYKHEIKAIIVRKDSEINLNLKNSQYSIYGYNENKKINLTITRKLKKEYQKKFLNYEQDLNSNFLKDKISYVRVFSKNEVNQKIKELLWI